MTDYSFEEIASKKLGALNICGIDEAGRGPWAGPVVAAAVILNNENIPDGLRDSKKLSANARERLATLIKKSAISYAIGIASPQEIDEINILRATFLAMKRAFDGLNIAPDFALIDGNRDPKIGIASQTIIKGDDKSVSIAAASILAKTFRDDLMKAAHKDYPQYGFDKNMGYGVPFHIAALNKHGPCPLHRMSFKPIRELPLLSNQDSK